MIRLRAVISVTSVVVVLVATGCRSTRTNQHVAIAQEPAAEIVQTEGETQPLSEQQLSISHLMQVAELLTIQHQYGQAAEIYQKVLQRDPGNAVAQQRLSKLPISDVPAQYGNPSQSQPVGSPPPAPPVIEEIPIIDDRGPTVPRGADQSPAFPTNPGAAIGQVPQISPPGLPPRQYRVSSKSNATEVVQPVEQGPGLGRTTPARNASSSKPAGSHTIQIIPATKNPTPQAKELKFLGDNPSTQTPPPSLNPVQETARNTTIAPVAGTEKKPEVIAEQQPKAETQPVQPAVEQKSVTAAKPTAKGAPKRLVPKELVELTGYAKNPAKHVDAIAKHLTHYSPRVRALSAYLLGRAGTAAIDELPKLEKALNDEQHGPAGIRIAEALVRLDQEHVVGLRTLENGLQSERRDTRWEAVCVADTVAKHEKRSGVLALLVERLHDVHADIRTMAALKLGEFRLDDSLVIGPLEEALHQSTNDQSLQKAAAVSLAAIRQTMPLDTTPVEE